MRSPAPPPAHRWWLAVAIAAAISATPYLNAAGAAQTPAAVSGRAPTVLAQRPAARLSGVIRDDGGRVLPGVMLTLEGEGLARPLTTVTDNDGRFRFEALPAGEFELRCEAPGFERWRRGVRMAAGGELALDVTMRQVFTAAPDPGPPIGPSPEPGTSPIVHPPRPGGRGDGNLSGGDDSDEPAPGNPSPDPGHELLEEIDAYLKQLDLGTIAFNAPDTMNIGESTQIRLLLSPNLSIPELQEKLAELPGTPQGAEIKIAPRMEAVLSGQQFSITAITPTAQAVSRESETEWRWEVSPTAAGRHRLHLALNAVILDTPRSLRTFEQTIDVDVTLGQQISGFVGANWQWLWTTALVPVAGWMWKRRAVRRRRVAD